MAKNKIHKRTKVYSQTNYQIRSIQEENSESSLMEFEGYAIVWDQPTALFEDYDGTVYYEQIDRNALDGAIMEDVPFKYNHGDKCFVPCRTRISTGEGSLNLTIDDFGLKVRGILADTTQSRDLYRLMQLGLINKMSFAFTVEEDSYNRETHTSTILKIAKLWDVSAVDDPAYPQTSISSLRSAEEAEMDIKAKTQKQEELDSTSVAEERNVQDELDNSRQEKVEMMKRKLKIDSLMSKL